MVSDIIIENSSFSNLSFLLKLKLVDSFEIKIDSPEKTKFHCWGLFNFLNEISKGISSSYRILDFTLPISVIVV